MKRVLVICYYWPPAGGPGVQRWLKFVTYFRDSGIEPVVYIPKNAHYPIQDQTLLTEVPEGIEILQKKIKEPYKYAQLFSKKKTKKISSGIIEEKKPSTLEKWMLFARGNFFIPDARIGWVKPSVDFLRQYLSNNKDIDTIITTGPPHSLHLIGMELKHVFGIKWIADFRDPWTTIHYHKSLRLTKKSKQKHQQLEKEVLQWADAVVVTSPSTQRDFEKLTSRPVMLITNGYEEVVENTAILDTHFSLAHIGSLLSNRNPELLWSSLSELCLEIEGFKEDLKITLVGLVSQEVKQSLEKFGLLKHVSLLGYVSHEEAIRYQNSAQVLLLIEMNKPETSAILPGKLFEYLRSKRPIISIGPIGSDIEAILKETHAGQFFSYSDQSALKKQISGLYQQYKKGSLTATTSNIEDYSRRNLTGRMAKLIKGLS
ncbi:MAG: glycosyltransferase family 4 protein [Flavobacteriaceae bacterium]